MIDERGAAYRRAEAALAVHRPDEARRILAPLAAADPGDAEVLTLLAESACQVGELAVAHDLTRRATAADPDNLRVLLRCADVARRSEDLDAAYYWANRAIELAPDDIQALHMMGLVEAARGFAPEAVTFTEEALRRRPDDPDMLVGYGSALAVAGRHGPSTAAYLKALRLDPQNVDALNNLAVARLQCGDLPRASRLLTAALSLDPRLDHARDNVGIVGMLARRVLLSGLGLGTVAAAGMTYLHVPAPWLLLLATVLWVVVSWRRLPESVHSRIGEGATWRDLVMAALILVTLPAATGLVAPAARPPTLMAWVVVFAVTLLAPLIWRRIDVAGYLLSVGLRLPRRF